MHVRCIFGLRFNSAFVLRQRSRVRSDVEPPNVNRTQNWEHRIENNCQFCIVESTIGKYVYTNLHSNLLPMWNQRRQAHVLLAPLWRWKAIRHLDIGSIILIVSISLYISGSYLTKEIHILPASLLGGKNSTEIQGLEDLASIASMIFSLLVRITSSFVSVGMKAAMLW